MDVNRRLDAVLLERSAHQRANGQVGHKVVVHDVEVHDIRTSSNDLLNLLAEPGEIGAENRRRDLVAGRSHLRLRHTHRGAGRGLAHREGVGTIQDGEQSDALVQHITCNCSPSAGTSRHGEYRVACILTGAARGAARRAKRPSCIEATCGDRR